MSRGPVAQDPELLRRLLRAKDRIDFRSHEDWPVRRLARGSGGRKLERPGRLELLRGVTRVYTVHRSVCLNQADPGNVSARADSPLWR
jgi:hypothetical protein